MCNFYVWLSVVFWYKIWYAADFMVHSSIYFLYLLVVFLQSYNLLKNFEA